MLDFSKIIGIIEAKAACKSPADDVDFNAMDYSGGNYDDCFELGVQEGKILFAHELLTALREMEKQ